MSETRDEKNITVAAKLYEFRKEARAFYGDQYPSRVDVFKRAIEKAATDFGGDRLKATLMLTRASERIPFGVLMFSAAYVELVEEGKA